MPGCQMYLLIHCCQSLPHRNLHRSLRMYLHHQNPLNLQTGAVDLIVHPDTENYRIRYWSDTASANIHFTLRCGDTIRKVIPNVIDKGLNTLLLPYNQWSKRAYSLNMYKDNKLTDTLNIHLR